MFQVVMALKDVGAPHETFEDAFHIFFKEIKRLVTEGASLSVLETKCYITCTFNYIETRVSMAMGWYGCKDLACKIGLICEDGKLADKPEINMSDIEIQNHFLKHRM